MFNFNKKEKVEPTRAQVRDSTVDSVNFSMRRANSLFNSALRHLTEAENSVLVDMEVAQQEIEAHKAEIKAEEELVTKLEKRTKAINKVKKNIQNNFVIDVEDDTQTPPSEE